MANFASRVRGISLLRPMAAPVSQQYACTSPPLSPFLFSLSPLAVRAQKSLGLVTGSPDYASVAGFVAPSESARTYTYSADGRLYAYALPTT
jgi:hypothetical protein